MRQLSRINEVSMAKRTIQHLTRREREIV